MATVYPTAAGTWSTRTWNDDATGAAYGPGTPQTGDTVLANGLEITIDVDITVESLRTTAGTMATAGGTFTTSGARVVNADSYGGSSICLSLADNSNSVQNGNSYGSDTGFANNGTEVYSTCTQNGDSVGSVDGFSFGSVISGGSQNGNASTRGSSVKEGGVLTGDSIGGSVAYAASVYLLSGGIQIGNATGGSSDGAVGTEVLSGGFFIGNSTGGTGAVGVNLNGGIQIGNATGGPGHPGTDLFSGVFYGDATGSSTHNASGLSIQGSGAIALVGTATGNAFGRFGVVSATGALHVVIISAESGTHPKLLTSGADTTYDLIPFADRPLPSAIATAVWSRVGRTLTS